MKRDRRTSQMRPKRNSQRSAPGRVNDEQRLSLEVETIQNPGGGGGKEETKKGNLKIKVEKLPEPPASPDRTSL